MPPEVSHPRSLTPKGRNKSLGWILLVVRDDGGLTRPFQVMSKALIHHQY
jgi:hypothetical protein